MTSVFRREGGGGNLRRKREEGGIGGPVSGLHTKAHQGSLAATEAGGGVDRTLLQSLQKEPTLPTPRLRTSGLQNCERVDFCCF